MGDQVFEDGAQRVLACAVDGSTMARAGDVSDFISAAWEHRATLVAIPVERLAGDFFRLRTGLAGEAIQTFVNYAFVWRWSAISLASLRPVRRCGVLSMNPIAATMFGSSATWPNWPSA